MTTSARYVQFPTVSWETYAGIVTLVDGTEIYGWMLEARTGGVVYKARLEHSGTLPTDERFIPAIQVRELRGEAMEEVRRVTNP